MAKKIEEPKMYSVQVTPVRTSEELMAHFGIKEGDDKYDDCATQMVYANFDEDVVDVCVTPDITIESLVVMCMHTAGLRFGMDLNNAPEEVVREFLGLDAVMEDVSTMVSSIATSYIVPAKALEEEDNDSND